MSTGFIAGARTRLGLLGGLIHGERAFVGPAYVTFDMTTRCNCICRGCLYHCTEQRRTSLDGHVVENLPLEVVRKVAPELARMSTHEVMLAGEGEPLLHPQFYEIVNAFRQAGLRVRSFTNAILLDETAAARIVRSGLDEVCATFWAVNREEHLAWHPGINPDFLERRKRGLQFLRQAKLKSGQRLPRLNLQLPLNRTNFRNIGERTQLALESGSDCVNFGVFRDYGGPFESECLSPTDRENMLDDMLAARDFLERAGIAHNVSGYLDRLRLGRNAWRECPCYIGWYQAYVKLDGSVLACCRCRLAMGNLKDSSFQEIWNSSSYRDFRRRALNPDELARMGQDCNCANCCYWHDNRRVHAVWRLLAPLTLRKPVS